MYFTKKSEVAVLLAVLLVLIGSSLFFSKGGITGAVTVYPQELHPQSTTLTTCGQLNISGESYILANDLSGTTANCIDIVAPGVTLDCNKKMITYNLAAGTTVAINDTDGFDNVHILNCNIREAAGRSPGAIFFVGVDNSSIENNNITATGTGSSGIVLDDSSGNLLINNYVNVTSVQGVSSIIINGSLATGNTLINNNISSETAYDIFHQNTRQNSLIYTNPFGSIIWNKTNITTGVDLSVSINVFLNNNSIGILDLAAGSSTAIAYNINSTAQIEIRNLTYQNTPDLLKNSVRCDNSTNDVGFACNITYSASLGILFANVTGFSNYTTQENDPPRVTILAPTNGSNYSFTIQDFNASVADNHSFVDTVIFVFTNGSNPFNLTASNNSITARLWNVTGVSSTLFSEGNHSFRVYANDSYKNVNYTETINFTIDRSAPLVATNQPASGQTVSGTAATFNAIVSDMFTRVEAVTFQISNGSTPFNRSVTNTGSFNIWQVTGGIDTTAITNGQNTLTIFANDTVSNVNTTFSINIFVDNAAPTVNITNPLANTNFSTGTTNFNATIRNVSTITETQFSTVTFQFSNSTGTPFNRSASNTSGTWNLSLDLTTLSEGSTVMTVFANDTKNNMNMTVNVSFIVDRTAPLVNSLWLNYSGPSQNNNTNHSLAIIRFNATVNDTSLSTQEVRFGFYNGNASGFNVSGFHDQAGVWSANISTASLSDGTYTVLISANDTLNNLNNTIANLTFVSDRTAPFISAFWFNTSNASNFSSSLVSILYFNATVNDTTLGVQEVRFGFYNGNTTGVNITGIKNAAGVWTANVTASALSDAVYTVILSANDTVDNRNNSIANLSFTLDRTAPIVRAFSMNASNASNFSSSLVSILYFNATVNDTTLGVQEVRFGFYNGNASGVNITGMKNVAGVWTANVTASALSDGIYTVILSANDTVDNRNNTIANLTFTLDRTPPTVSITSPADGATLTGTQSFNATIRDAIMGVNAVIFQFSNGTTPFNRTATNSSGNWNVTIDTTTLKEGALTVTVFANDTLGNMNNSNSISITIDNIPVTSSSSSGASTSSDNKQSPPTPKPSPPPPQPAPSLAETANALETYNAFRDGEASMEINFKDNGFQNLQSYTSEENYLLTITNNLKKKIILSGILAEEQLPLENEENARKLITEKLSLQGKVDEAAIEKELAILKLLQNVKVLEVYKTKESHFFPLALTGAAIASLQPSGEHIQATLLKDLLLNAGELEGIEVNPGQTLQKEVKIRRGLSLEKKRPPKIIFSSQNLEILSKDLDSIEKIVTGTAVDVNPQTKKLDLYIVIAPKPDGGKETFTMELNINSPKSKLLNSLPLKLKLPFIFSGDTQSIYSELYGPYTIDLSQGALLATQYDASSIPSDYEVVGKVYLKGTDLIAENHFDIKSH